LGQAPETLDGWFALHDVRRVDWPSWRRLTAAERQRALDEAVAFLSRAAAAEEGHRGSSGLFWVLGHKGDLMQVHLRPEAEELYRLELEFDRLALSEHLTRTYSYFSVVELSTHTSEGRAQGSADDPGLRRRLEPHLPRTRYVCFYPMSKRRGERENWFTLSHEERGAMMRSHGLIGRRYAERVVQIVTGSMGLDDWEWGVSLFADDPLQFKKIVYEMRFDEASARFALFGSFFVGSRLEPGDLPRYLAV
jgi:peroxiredoxin